MRNLLLLLALLIVPFARLGLAPASLATNRRGRRPQSSGPPHKLLTALAVAMSALAVLLAIRGQSFSRINAGEPTLRLLMTGKGSPTVIFEAGAGGPLETWTRIQPAVSEFARTISYDRAGNGLSIKGPLPRDGWHVATELHQVLQNAHVSPPYILVGHSLGGPFIRVFAGLVPNKVAGMVLVDPTREELIAWAKARHPQGPNPSEPRPDNEVECAPATFAQASERPMPADIPVTLITGMGPREHPKFLSKELRTEVEKDQKIFYPAKLKFHQAWLDRIPGGRLIVTDKSGHGIPLEEPELVIRAIRDIIRKATKSPGVAGVCRFSEERRTA